MELELGLELEIEMGKRWMDRGSGASGRHLLFPSEKTSAAKASTCRLQNPVLHCTALHCTAPNWTAPPYRLFVCEKQSREVRYDEEVKSPATDVVGRRYVGSVGVPKPQRQHETRFG